MTLQHQLCFVVSLIWLCFNSITVYSSYINCFITTTESTAECVRTNFPAFTKLELLKSKNDARNMFQFGYDNYMQHAYPQDELDPIHCTGRGHDYVDE